MVCLNRSAMNPMASSQLVRSHVPLRRIIGLVGRSGEYTYSNAYRPFTHKCPWLLGPSFAGRTSTIRPSRVPTCISQPVPQYAQMVLVQCVGTPRARIDLSSSAPVGHESTHAPQLTHSLWAKLAPVAGRISVS